MTKNVSSREFQLPRELRNTGTLRCLRGCPLPPSCTRERARQHVKQTGHTVHFTTERTTIYEPAEGP